MFRLGVVVVSLVGIAVFLALGFLAVISWEILGVMTAVLIGIAGLLLAYLPREEKKNVTQKTQTPEEVPAKPAPTPRPIMNETIVVGYDEYSTYDIDAKVGVEILGEISSDHPINFYFLTKYGLRKFEEDEDFSYEYGSEGCVKCDVHFVPSRTLTLHLVIENKGREKATVHVSLRALKLSGLQQDVSIS